MHDRIRFKDIEIYRDGDDDGVFVKGRGGTRFIAYEELVEMADSDNEVTVR